MAGEATQLLQPFGDLLRENARLREIIRLSHGLVSNLNYEQVLGQIADAASRLTGARFAVVWMADGAYFSVKARSGDDGGYLSRMKVSTDPNSPLGRGPGAQAFHEKIPVVVDDMLSDPRLGPWREEHAQYGGRSMAVVPLVHNDKALGILEAYATEVGAFTADRVEILVEFSVPAAIAMANARLYGELKNRTDQLAVFEHLGALVTSLADEQATVELMAGRIHQMYDCPAVMMFTTAAGETMSLRCVKGIHAHLFENLTAALQIEGRVALQVAGQDSLQCCMDLPAALEFPPDVRAMLEAADLRKGLVQPLHYRGELLGVMAFLCDKNREVPERFPQHITVLANYIATAIANARLYDQSRRAATVDSVTGVYNHRFFQDRLRYELARTEAGGQPLAVIFCDVDHFKQVNDTGGHQYGDEVLRQIAAVLQRSVSARDVVARYGGDEFALILPGADLKTAQQVAHHVRAEVEAAPAIPCTLSVGVAVFPDHAATREELIGAADEAAWLAKRSGGNRVYEYDAAARGAMLRSVWFDLVRDPVMRQTVGEKYLNTIQSLLAAVEAKDQYTHSHSEGVARYARATAQAMGLSPEQVRIVTIGGLLHDIGKIGIPEPILCKNGRLTPEEYKVMQEHPALGYNILQHLPVPREVALIALHHQERFDGQGYPAGLQGHDIPLHARIVTVCDAFHTMTSDRPYRKARPIADAVEELRRYAGIMFDPDIVDVFVQRVVPQQVGRAS